MLNKILIVVFTMTLFFGVHIPPAQGVGCDPNSTAFNHGCGAGLDCVPLVSDPNTGTCETNDVGNRFGKIQPPQALSPFLKNDATGAKGISKFLSNLVALIYTMASIAVVFMLVWGAFDWLTSGGNKEQLEKARSRIINAIIGIVLLAAVFAILNVLHVFTGFSFST